MICHKNKLIFIHLPKCGGTSIEMALTGQSWHRDETRREQHMTAAETQELYGKDIFASYFKFTIVRNPWDLIVACYLWGCWGLRGHADTNLRGRLTRYFGRTRAWGHPYRKEVGGFGKHPTLTEYVENIEKFNKALDFSASGTDLSQQRAAISIGGKIMVDYVGKFENLNDEFGKICNLAGVSAASLPHRMKSSRSRHYSQYYSVAARELVRRKYIKDIESFDYAFEDQCGPRS